LAIYIIVLKERLVHIKKLNNGVYVHIYKVIIMSRYIQLLTGGLYLVTGASVLAINQIIKANMELQKANMELQKLTLNKRKHNHEKV
jgi:hypothetical protein